MPKFRFAVRSNEGKLRTGTVTEASLEAARDRLKSAGFMIVSLAEETELVIHEAKATGGVALPKAERAAIIEFETTLGERISEFLSRFVLRKEFAALLFLVGIGIAAMQIINRPKPPADTGPKYQLFSIEVRVEPGGPTGGDTYEVMLPDIPAQFSRKVADGLLLKDSFETSKQPGRVEVRLKQGREVVAQGDGLLSVRQVGVLVGSVPLAKVKKKL